MQPSARTNIPLPLVLGIAILAVSTASIFIRFAQQQAPSLVIAAGRLAIATLVIAPVVLLRHRAELRLLTRRELLLGILSGIFLALHFAAWIASLEYTTVASSVVLVSSSPIWVALLGSVFLHEKPARLVILGMLIAVLGGIIIFLGDLCSWRAGLTCTSLSVFFQDKTLWGNFLALLGAWAVTGYLLIGRRLRRKMSLFPYIFIVYGAAAFLLLVLIIFTHQPIFGYSSSTYHWILLLALIPQLIGHSTYNYALRYLPASLVAVTTLGEPVGSTILAYLILQEIPSWLTILGGVLILAGIWLSSRGAAPSHTSE